MNIRGLGDVKKEIKDEKNKKNRETYAGGESSGLAIENPNDISSKIVNKA